jgi:hypothetical protein
VAVSELAGIERRRAHPRWQAPSGTEERVMLERSIAGLATRFHFGL